MTDPPADLTGRTLGDFHVLRRIGSGGMGQVYLARQLSLKREVALKLLRNDLAQSETALKRFQAEAEAVARISHPNIVQVYAVGEHDGLKFMALEYVEGRNLREFLSKKGPPDLPVALTVIRQVALALQKAGELGVVHRDIKPENILVTRRAEVKVTDFGLSRLTAREAEPLNLTQSGVTVGTPLYMAPEQVRGLPTDHRTDLYALGATCFHLLAGQPPFTGTTAFEVAMRHVNDPPPRLADVRPDLPPGLCDIVLRLMAKNPDDRYPSAKEVLRDLAKVRDGRPVEVPAAAVSGTVSAVVPAAPRPPRWPGRALGGLALAAVFAGGWAAFGRTHRPPDISPAAAGPGLPDARLPDGVALATTRERALVARLHTRGLSLAEVTDAGIELGLLYVKERRFADALKTFESLEQEKSEPRGAGRAGPPPLPGHQVAGRFGVGIVLAHQDKAKESVDAFEAGVRAVPRVGGGGAGLAQLQQFLFDRPDLSQAVAEALNRDADNLKLTKLPSPVLQLLRSPTTQPRGK